MRARLGRAFVPFLAVLASACAGASTPDLVIRHAKVFTNDTARPWAEAVAIKGERVVAVGEDAAIAALSGGSTRVIDAGGRVLVPGFNDARVDLPLEPPTPQGLAALDRDAVAHGVTSLQVVAGGPMRSLVVAAQQAERTARWRLIRSPMDGERPQDEEPYLPPDPGVRLQAKGVSWTVGSDGPRVEIAVAQLKTAVGWAYGAEDPVIFLAGGLEPVTAILDAMERRGIADVWQRKRPRLDIRHSLMVLQSVTRARQLGLVVTWLPTSTRAAGGQPSIWNAPVTSGGAADSGLVVAGGSAGLPTPMAVLTSLASAGHAMAGPTLSREKAVRAMTWGSAYAEKAERDKGWLGAGTLADLAILSDDVFTLPAERLPAITSVLTLVGGTIVYDPGVLTVR